MWLPLLWACHPADLGPVTTAPDTGAPTLDSDTGEPPLPVDGDGDGATADIDCDDADPERFPGAYEVSGDGLDTDCDGWDARPLSQGAGVTAQAEFYAFWLQFGHDLDAGDLDGDGDDEVFAGSQHYDKYADREGIAAILDGESLAQTGAWVGSVDSSTARRFGGGVAVASSPSGPAVAFLAIFGVWVVDPAAPSGDPGRAGGFYVQGDASPGGYMVGNRLHATQVIGDPDEDLLVECGNNAPGGEVCILQGPVRTDGSLTDADLIVTGGPGLGSGLGGADVDGDGQNDLILGASNAAEDRGEISVLLGPLATGRADVTDGARTWQGENLGDWLGQAVSDGDLDGDGVSEVVGAAMAWPDNDRRGRVYGLALGASDVAAAHFVIDGDPGAQHLGMSMATGDLDDDGQDDLAVGGPSTPVDFSVPGRIFVYFGPVSGALTSADADVTYVGEAPGDGAGVAVTIGDVDGNGIDDLVVASPYQDTAAEDSGKVYLLAGPLVP